METINSQIQESPQTPRTKNLKKITSHITIKLHKIKIKEKNLKAVRKKVTCGKQR